MALAWLDRVESNLEHRVGPHLAIPALARDGRFHEMLGELLDLRVGETRVGFADV